MKKEMHAPLATRMRPETLDEFLGQEKVLGKGKPLRVWIETDHVPSLLLWGPPGCGKTTLAHLIARYTQSQFQSLSAVLVGLKEIREVISLAKHQYQLAQTRTILFIDEIHRFNKAQQDALLPHVENGTVTLIGATTENPSFEVNPALLSRVRVIRLERLGSESIQVAIHRALEDPKRGLGGTLHLSGEAIQWLSRLADGDVRRALSALECLYLSFSDPNQKSQLLNLSQVQAVLESALGKQPLLYDQRGEEHYNIISAFIKSLRDSDPHAGLYYLARMLASGEDPLFIARRLVIFASEDVGNADPRALQIAIATKEAIEFVGLPEARINLAQAVTYLALAPKSNASYLGLEEALKEVEQSGSLEVPFHLRNAVTGLMRTHGYGKGYQYAHSLPQGQPKQTHLPKPLVGRRFYHPKEIGFEAQIKAKLDHLNSQFE